MGGRDIRHREAKKTKKSDRSVKVEVLTPSPEVEVVKKGKGRKDREADT